MHVTHTLHFYLKRNWIPNTQYTRGDQKVRGLALYISRRSINSLIFALAIITDKFKAFQISSRNIKN